MLESKIKPDKERTANQWMAPVTVLTAKGGAAAVKVWRRSHWQRNQGEFKRFFW